MSDEQTTNEFYKPGQILNNGTVFDPSKHKVFSNGAVYDMERKRIVSAPAPEFAPITKRNAKALAHHRWDESREAFAAGFAQGMVDKDTAPISAWLHVGRKSAELLKDAKSARGFADLARFAGESAGFIAAPRGREDGSDETNEQQPQVTIILSQFIALLPPAAPPDQAPDADLGPVDGEIID